MVSYDFTSCPMVFLWFSVISPVVLWVSYGFPMISPVVLWVSYGFPMISPFSYGFPVVSPFLPAHPPVIPRGTRGPPGLAASAPLGSAGAAETVRRSTLGSTSSVVGLGKSRGFGPGNHRKHQETHRKMVKS